MRIRLFFFGAVLLLLLNGCGYTLAGRSSSTVQGRSLYPALFTNRSYQPDVEAELRRALLDELAQRGEEIGPEGSADLILAGEIDVASSAITAYSAADTAKMYAFTLQATVTLRERKSGKVILKFTESVRQDYPVTANINLQRNSREAGIKAACGKLALVIAEKMNQAF